LTFRDAIASISGSSFRLSVAATIAAILAMLLPFIGFRVDVGFAATSASLSGADAAGWVAWLTVLVFAAAAASHKVAGLYPYKNLLELGAVAAAVGMAVWAWFMNPAAAQASQAAQVIRQFAPSGSPMPDMMKQYPHLGLFLLAAAAALMLLAHRRGRSEDVS
jgi:hypothetical protein